MISTWTIATCRSTQAAASVLEPCWQPMSQTPAGRRGGSKTWISVLDNERGQHC